MAKVNVDKLFNQTDNQVSNMVVCFKGYKKWEKEINILMLTNRFCRFLFNMPSLLLMKKSGLLFFGNVVIPTR